MIGALIMFVPLVLTPLIAPDPPVPVADKVSVTPGLELVRV